MVIGKRAFKVLKEISYERLGGTNEELSALEILKREVESEGVSCEIEEFEVNSYNIECAEFVVTEPKKQVYKVNGFGMCGSTPVEGIDADFVYVESTKYIPMLDLKGKAVLLTTPLGYQVYEDLFCSPRTPQLQKRLLTPLGHKHAEAAAAILPSPKKGKFS